MFHAPHSPWLHRFAVLTAMATLMLIWVGGLVTSHGAGMAVPDWPTTYGYNMFFFPFSKWAGGIFYEHSHRIIASVVGLLTAILAGWIWARESTGWPRRIALCGILATLGLMGVRTQPMFVAMGGAATLVLCGCVVALARSGRKLRWLGGIAFCAVLIQGVLGGLRVTAMKDEIGVFHGTLAQLFFALLCVIALVTSRWWRRTEENLSIYDAGPLRYSFAFVTGLILAQLILGATMRHQHAGLAIPDFPTAYGSLWPATDEASIARYNQNRIEVNAANSITAGSIVLQMTHRVMALCIFLGVAWLAGVARSRFGGRSPLARLGAIWFGVILLQVILGAATIWTGKAADIATAHVAVGALSLITGTVISLAAFRAAQREAGQRAGHVLADASPGLKTDAAHTSA